MLSKKGGGGGPKPGGGSPLGSSEDLKTSRLQFFEEQSARAYAGQPATKPVGAAYENAVVPKFAVKFLPAVLPLKHTAGAHCDPREPNGPIPRIPSSGCAA